MELCSGVSFVLFINDVSDCISVGANIALYADDTKIWRRIELDNDHNILQKDIDSLYSWSTLNKMKFHPLKCKVLSVTSCHSLHNYILPTSRFAYCLNGECLDYIETEKDLGVHIHNKLSWNQHIFYLCSKANRMLGLVKRTCKFVKEHNQKRVLYLSLVSSQFNHCSPVWRPASVTLLNKIERVQVNAIKWILCEEGSTYTDLAYFKKCRELELLPLKFRLDFFAILLFHRVIYETVAIKLPEYIKLARPSALRSSHQDPLTYTSTVRPRVITKTKKNLQSIKKL